MCAAIFYWLCRALRLRSVQALGIEVESPERRPGGGRRKDLERKARPVGERPK